MAEGKLFIKKDGECIPFDEVKDVDLSEMEIFGKYESNAPCLNVNSLPEQLALILADIDWRGLFRAQFGSLKKYTMMARRAAKKTARLKRKEFYLARCRTKARYYNDYCLANVPKRIELPPYKWNVPLGMIRRLY